MSQSERRTRSNENLLSIRIEITRLVRDLSEDVLGSEKRFLEEVLLSFQPFLRDQAIWYFRKRLRGRDQAVFEEKADDVVGDMLTPNGPAFRKAVGNAKGVFDLKGVVTRIEIWRYLSTTCRDVCSTVLRKHIRTLNEAGGLEEIAGVPDESGGTGAHVEGREELLAVEAEATKHGVSYEDQQIYAWREGERLTFAQIAHRLEGLKVASEGTYTESYVRNRYPRIRDQMQECGRRVRNR